MNTINISRYAYAKIARNHLPKNIQCLFLKKLQREVKNYSTLIGTKCGLINNVEELEIPLSYGKLAAKAWGYKKGKPVLAFHGWLDNCGTYDNLMPLLKDQFYIVTVDAPGHGMSSHKPPECLYTDTDAILDYKRVIDFFGWSKVNLLGHSLGGGIALLFASLFPEIVEKAVIIEMPKPFSLPQNEFPKAITDALTDILKFERKLTKPAPIYTYESALQRLIESMYNEITIEGAEILMKRGTCPSKCKTGVVFSRDLRCIPMEFTTLRSHELIYQYLSGIKCELMMIIATKCNLKAFMYSDFNSHTSELLEKAYEVYKTNTKKFILEYVDGNHFVHLNEPKKIAPLINDFFLD